MSKKKITNLLAHSERDLNLCAHVYCQIASADEDEQSDLLRYFLTEFRKTKTDMRGPLTTYISNSELPRLKAEFQKKGHDFFLRLRQQNPTEPEFYRRLWEYIATSPELPSTEARVFTLYNMATDRRIPYCQVGWDKLAHMEDEEFHRLSDDFVKSEFNAKLNYILEYPHRQQTEYASLVINLLDSLPDRLKPILLARVFSYNEAKLTVAAFAKYHEEVDHIINDNDGTE